MIAFVAPFGMQPKGTVSARMMPLARALAERGHVVRVVIPPWDDPSEQGLARPRVDNLPASSGVGFVQVVTLPLPKRLPRSLALTYDLVRWAVAPPPGMGANTFRPYTVHVFKPVGYSGLAGLVLQAMRVPWVLDTDDWEGPGGWVGVNPYSPAQKVTITLMEALLPRMACAVTAASRALEARAWSFGIPRERVFYLPNGVSQERYGSWAGGVAARADGGEPGRVLPPDVRDTLQDGPVILLYTRFAEFPYRWPLHILKHVLSEHPTAKLLVVGNGFFAEEEKLRKEAQGAGLGAHVIVTGRVAEEDIPSYLALADVALYPMRDNLINRAKSPVKLLEQMVMGLPIVAHKVGQVPHLLGDTGIIIEPGNVRGMAKATSLLLREPELRNRLGQTAQKRVWAEFNWERLSEVAEKAYMIVAKYEGAK